MIRWQGHTERIDGTQLPPHAEQIPPQPLVDPIRDHRVDDQDEVDLEPLPQPAPAIFTLDDLRQRLPDGLPRGAELTRLLPRDDDGDGVGAELRHGAAGGAQAELRNDAVARVVGRVGAQSQGEELVQGAGDGGPVEVGEVEGGGAEDGAAQAAVEAGDALMAEDLPDGVDGAVVASVVRLVVGDVAVPFLTSYLDL